MKNKANPGKLTSMIYDSFLFCPFDNSIVVLL